MANTEFSLRDIGTNLLSQYPAIVRLPKINTPYTAIVNRAQVTDFSNDLLPRMGVDRFLVQQIVEVQSEYGPNGERVFKPINDAHDAVRFVGVWVSSVNTAGQYNGTGSGGSNADYVEITFFGTGLNLLMITANGSARTLAVTVDGGSSSSVQWDTTTNSNVINSRNYSQNAVVRMATGLTAGLHTVKIQQNNGTNFFVVGYEVINSNSSLQLVPGQMLSGGRRLNKASPSTDSYNSGFESGTLGTRGGHVLVYQKADGTIAKAVTPTNSSAAYLTNADHTNEEIIRTYHWREFSAGRFSPADDFHSLATPTGDRMFTLDDGTTTLIGANIAVRTDTPEAIALVNNSTSFWTFTFVGTGLDIVRQDSAVGGSDTYTITVDGATPTPSVLSTTGSTFKRVEKIVSGLPYGTHTVRLTRTSASTFVACLHQLIVYGPKTPALPAGAVPLADYFIMANYAADTTYGNAHRVSTGVLRKVLMREAVHSGTWTVASPDTSFASGFNTRSNTAGSFVELWFFGTGINYRPYIGNLAYNFTFTIDDAAPTTSTFTTSATGLTYTPGTGVLSGTASGAASYAAGLWSVTGLTLGMHKLRVTFNSSGDYLYTDAFDVITPIHVPKDNGPLRLQNVANIGSCGIRDLRNFGEQQIPRSYFYNVCRAIGIQSGVTTTTSTTLFLPTPDMSVTHKSATGRVRIEFSAMGYHSVSGGEQGYRIYVNGSVVGALFLINAPQISYYAPVSGFAIVDVPVGTSKIDIHWATNGGTLSQPAGATRTLEVIDI